MKTALVFLLSLTIAIVLPNPVWAHGGGGGGGGGGGSAGGGGGGSGSSAGGGGNGGSHGGGNGGNGGNGGSSSSVGGGHGGSKGGSSIGLGVKGGGMGHAGGRGVGAAHGHSNTPATAFGRAIGLIAKALGHGNGPGTAHGRGFGSHAGLGNPGHNGLAGRSSHSQNNSHKGETHDGRSFSNNAHAEHSLAQDPVAHITKAHQAAQADDNDPGKAKGFAVSLPPSQEVQADHSVTLNLNPIHSDLEDFANLGPQSGQEPEADSGWTLNPVTIHLDLENFANLRLQPDQELLADAGWNLSPDTIHSEVDDTLTRGLPRVLALNLARLDRIFLETDDTPATTFPNREALDDVRAKTLPPTSPELDDDDATGWKLFPFYGLVLVLIAMVFSCQGILRMFKRDTFRQPTNP
jgi:hypothetical protein